MGQPLRVGVGTPGRTDLLMIQSTRLCAKQQELRQIDVIFMPSRDRQRAVIADCVATDVHELELRAFHVDGLLDA